MIILILALLGICFGSFVNAYVWRLHEQGKRKKAAKDLSLIHGRSMCPNCKHTLAAKDLVPVLSWLKLRGKCRYCKKPISWQYPLVELVTAGLFIGSYLLWPYGFELAGIVQFSLWLVILILFMVLLVYDLRWMLLPNKVVYPLIVITVVSLVLGAGLKENPSLLVGALGAVLCLAGFFYVLFQVSDGKWIGGGDVKLAVALGLLASSPTKALLLLFIASLIGVIATLPQLIRGKKGYSSQIPFGPFLIAGTIIVYIVGDRLIDWYLNSLIGL